MYSKVLPAGLSAHYAEARDNPALTALTEQIALVDAKIFELLEQLTRRESPAAWGQVYAVAQAAAQSLVAFHQARRPPLDLTAMTTALTELEGALSRLMHLATHGIEDTRAWALITTQLYLRKKLVDSEVKRQQLSHETMTKDRALGLVAFIAASIMRHVLDPKAKQAIIDDIRPLLTVSSNSASNA